MTFLSNDTMPNSDPATNSTPASSRYRVVQGTPVPEYHDVKQLDVALDPSTYPHSLTSTSYLTPPYLSCSFASEPRTPFFGDSVKLSEEFRDVSQASLVSAGQAVGQFLGKTSSRLFSTGFDSSSTSERPVSRNSDVMYLHSPPEDHQYCENMNEGFWFKARENSFPGSASAPVWSHGSIFSASEHQDTACPRTPLNRVDYPLRGASAMTSTGQLATEAWANISPLSSQDVMSLQDSCFTDRLRMPLSGRYSSPLDTAEETNVPTGTAGIRTPGAFELLSSDALGSEFQRYAAALSEQWLSDESTGVEASRPKQSNFLRCSDVLQRNTEPMNLLRPARENAAYFDTEQGPANLSVDARYLMQSNSNSAWVSSNRVHPRFSLFMPPPSTSEQCISPDDEDDASCSFSRLLADASTASLSPLSYKHTVYSDAFPKPSGCTSLRRQLPLFMTPVEGADDHSPWLSQTVPSDPAPLSQSSTYALPWSVSNIRSDGVQTLYYDQHLEKAPATSSMKFGRSASLGPSRIASDYKTWSDLVEPRLSEASASPQYLFGSLTGESDPHLVSSFSTTLDQQPVHIERPPKSHCFCEDHTADSGIHADTISSSYLRFQGTSEPLTKEARRVARQKIEQDTGPDNAACGNQSCQRSSENSIQVEDIDEEQRFVLHLAILTLYKDQIKPHHIEIRHRLQELHGSPALEKNFLLIYEALDSQYIVKRSGTSSAAVYLRETPSWFSGWVDMRDIHNPYPIRLWLAFYGYVIELLRAENAESTGEAGSRRKTQQALLEPRGGRYGMSKRLKTCGPPIFRNYSLGQVCHIVQLAVHLGILAYEGASLLPAASCRSVIRKLYPPIPESVPATTGSSREPPKLLQGCSPENEDENEKHTQVFPVMVVLDEVVRNLEILLNAKDFKPMLLSQLKFRFLHKFRKRFDPAVFGFARLSDFLTERCSHCCRLVREGGRQVLVDRVVPPADTSNTEQQQPALPALQFVSNDNPEPMMADESECHGDDKFVIEESDGVRLTKGLLALLSKHYRFHFNLTYSFWQYCTVADEHSRESSPLLPKTLTDGFARDARTEAGKDLPILFSHAATFTDVLFASILRPASTEPFLSSQCPPNRSTVYPEVCALRWFTRQPLVERQLGQGEPLDEEDCSVLQDIFFGVLPPRLPTHTSSFAESAKGPRPSKLRRQITSQMAQLKRDIFSVPLE